MIKLQTDTLTLLTLPNHLEFGYICNMSIHALRMFGLHIASAYDCQAYTARYCFSLDRAPSLRGTLSAVARTRLGLHTTSVPYLLFASWDRYLPISHTGTNESPLSGFPIPAPGFAFFLSFFFVLASVLLCSFLLNHMWFAWTTPMKMKWLRSFGLSQRNLQSNGSH